MTRFFAATAFFLAAGCSSGSTGAGSGGAAITTIPADGGDTWSSFAESFFARYCVECHAAGSAKGLDFTQHGVVTANKDLIRCGVAVHQDPSWNCASFPPAEQFPISDSAGTNPKPSDAERNYVVGWIDAGCP